MSKVSYLATLAVVALGFEGCGASRQHEHAPFVSLAEVEANYGPLVTVGNFPTPYQSGTGDRVGLFRDATGTLWGLPLTVSSAGDLLACAPQALRNAGVTDALPSGMTIVGATNEPTDWREGTGRLELIVRNLDGAVRGYVVTGANLPSGPGCSVSKPPATGRHFYYYRLTPATE